jgi:hypothetical protein
MLPPPGFDFPSKNSAEPEIEMETTPSRDVRERGGRVDGWESRGMGKDGWESRGMGKKLVMEDRGSDFC